MMGRSVEVSAERRGQRNRSVLNREDAPFRAPERLLRSRPKASARVWSPWNWLAEQPNPGRIVNTAGGGRQQEVIREMSDRR
jgi:hypothetical protein